MDVGIRELKAKLSEYVERAARGESIRVTDRGTPKAVLAPLPDDPVRRGIDEGWISRASDVPPVRVRRVRVDVTSEDLIAEDRGE